MSLQKIFVLSSGRFSAVVALAVMSVASVFAIGQTESVLYNFQGGSDGYYPGSKPIGDKAGNLYGTNDGNFSVPGNVFQLKPPAAKGGSWTFTVLYTFTGGNDGEFPFGSLAMDGAGNLYGATLYGGSSGCSSLCGTIFRLAPPTQGGTWTETVIHSFTAGIDGWQPEGGVILDGAGNLYGTTSAGGRNCSAGCGTVFRLRPPLTAGGAWTKTVLYDFQGGSDAAVPVAELVMDSQHNLYGKSASGGAAGMGTIFELSPPTKVRGAWNERVLHSFTTFAGSAERATTPPPKFIASFSGLTRDSAGALYGALYSDTSGFGSVFQLSPPGTTGGAWSYATIYQFQGGSDGANPAATLVLNNAGSLFGSTLYGGSSNQGTLFELSPPTQPGEAWTESILHRFVGGSDGANPNGGLSFGKGGLLYGTTSDGGDGTARVCSSGFGPGPGCGTIFSIIE